MRGAATGTGRMVGSMSSYELHQLADETGLTESEVRLPGRVDRRVRTSRCRDPLPQRPVERHGRGSVAGAVSGHDRRVRTRSDSGTVASWKRHRARAGEISVLGGAPYGYRYIRKRDDNPAAYVRWLNEQGVPTRKVGTRWERSTVWAMLRNPAYRGTACFGKTRRARRQRVTRPLRLRGGAASRDSANHERPREEWIEIPVPAIVDESTFRPRSGAAAREQGARPAAHGRTEPRAGAGQLPEMRLRAFARVGPVERLVGLGGVCPLGGANPDSRPWAATDRCRRHCYTLWHSSPWKKSVR